MSDAPENTHNPPRSAKAQDPSAAGRRGSIVKSVVIGALIWLVVGGAAWLAARALS